MRIISFSAVLALGSRSGIEVEMRNLGNISREALPPSVCAKIPTLHRVNAFTQQLRRCAKARKKADSAYVFYGTLIGTLCRAPPPLFPTPRQACQKYMPANLRERNNIINPYLILRDEKLAIAELQPKVAGNGSPSISSPNSFQLERQNVSQRGSLFTPADKH